MRCALVAGARRAACGAHRAHSAAARLAVTAGCGADRLSIHDVSARHQAGNGPLLEHVRVDRRSCSSDFACCCESWDVHGCRTDRRGARPRPDRKARRYRPSAHDNRPRFWARRSVADGFPAGRGVVVKAMLLRAAVAEGRWWWAVDVVTGGLLAGLCFSRARPGIDRPDRAIAAVDDDIAGVAGDRFGADTVCGAARFVPFAPVGTTADRPPRNDNQGARVTIAKAALAPALAVPLAMPLACASPCDTACPLSGAAAGAASHRFRSLEMIGSASR